MNLDEASLRFRTALVHCDNLVEVHQAFGKKLPGKRFKEISVNRAVVVIAVAAWQAAVQDMTAAIVDESRPPLSAPMPLTAYNVVAGQITKAVSDFSTPNAENSRRLLGSAGFDPYPFWTWSTAGRPGRGAVLWTPEMARRRLNEWLKLRHAIAHGHEVLPASDALECVREGGGPDSFSGIATLRLDDAKTCVSFVRRLADLSGRAVAGHLGVSVPSWKGRP